MVDTAGPAAVGDRKSVSHLNISCVVPSHNRPRMLQEALKAIKAQTLLPLEVLVVDDFGSDEVESVVRAFAADGMGVTYLRDLPGHTDGTAGRSRNIGAAAADGAYLAFLDDDDLWDTDHLESLAFAVGDRRLDLAIAPTDFVRGDHRSRGFRPTEDVTAAEVLTRNPGLTGSNFLISADAFDALDGFDEVLPVGNDRDFLIRLLDVGVKYAVIDHATVQQRAHDEGQLTARTLRRAEGLRVFARKYASRMSSSDKRELRRVLHSIERYTAPSWFARSRHLAAQVVLSNPGGVLRGLLQRVRSGGALYR